ncbi:LamG domain-containing protein [Variovorax sp. OV329]|uniref:LamG domain-containing protein n=1 Tax=Variovorax sp. OV329 TaxID=1882825 RepID=UPI0008F1C195|nr:LamG domain-containing protein [Variovorax sp. OV329]SFN27569.1 Concanavalin A-like lectin/glucanases superfamily protein [Variovorax sp. OV329]
MPHHSPWIHLRVQPHRLKAAIASIVVLSSLAACGGGGDSTSPSSTSTPPLASGGGSDGPSSDPVNAGHSGPKVLMIQVDGLTYAALQGLHAGGALASLKAAPAWTGGVGGTPSEQPTTTGPAWATLLTGTWARHGVKYDGGGQHIDIARTPTLLAQARQRTQPYAYRTSVVASSLTAASLGNDAPVAAGIDDFVDCAADDNCVTTHAARLIAAGSDLLVAEYAAPAQAALDGLGSSAYRASVGSTAAGVQRLLDTIARRQAQDPKEDWLVLLASDHGLDAFGSATGAQSLQDKTVVIASNKSLALLPGVGTVAPADLATLMQGASAADLAPTALAHLGLLPAAAQRGFDGIALQATTAVRQLRAATGSDKASLVLSWTLAGNTDVPVQVLRDGTLVATLAAGSTGYNDAIVAPADGVHRYRYTVVAGDSATGLDASINYVKPVVLAPTLAQGLALYYPFGALAPTDAMAASTMASWAADADGGSLVSDDPFKPAYKAKALRVDANVKNASGLAGYRLLQASDVATDASVTAYTIGFWMRTDATCSQGVSNGASVVANKNYDSGSAAGLAIGLFGSCEIRFNVGTGSARADSNGYKLSAGQWAYVAVVIDKASLKMSGYVIDPALGTQAGSTAITSALVAKLGGLGNGIGLNEDGTGLYYQRNAASPRGAMDFDDFAIWKRALTADEIATLFKSGQPLSTLAH